MIMIMLLFISAEVLINQYGLSFQVVSSTLLLHHHTWYSEVVYYRVRLYYCYQFITSSTLSKYWGGV